MPLFHIPKAPFTMERLSAISTTPVTLTADTYNDVTNRQGKADGAFLTVEGESIIYTVDGSTPSASNGHTAAALDAIVLETYASIVKFKCIKAGANNATVQVTYFRS